MLISFAVVCLHLEYWLSSFSINLLRIGKLEHTGTCDRGRVAPIRIEKVSEVGNVRTNLNCMLLMLCSSVEIEVLLDLEVNCAICPSYHNDP